ncbi:hypothetical protein DFJ73DRAFT_944045 [Zopfochytrium polystomum]|nr:hypothetical protein DFJ73DRAFT_944045 [Zopfochytrium polystomum]
MKTTKSATMHHPRYRPPNNIHSSSSSPASSPSSGLLAPLPPAPALAAAYNNQNHPAHPPSSIPAFLLNSSTTHPAAAAGAPARQSSSSFSAPTSSAPSPPPPPHPLNSTKKRLRPLDDADADDPHPAHDPVPTGAVNGSPAPPPPQLHRPDRTATTDGHDATAPVEIRSPDSPTPPPPQLPHTATAAADRAAKRLRAAALLDRLDARLYLALSDHVADGVAAKVAAANAALVARLGSALSTAAAPAAATATTATASAATAAAAATVSAAAAMAASATSAAGAGAIDANVSPPPGAGHGAGAGAGAAAGAATNGGGGRRHLPDGTDACHWFAKDDDASRTALRDMMFLAQGFVQARRLSDGAILWSFVDDGLGPHPFLLIEDGVLHVGGVGELFALDARSGSLLWSTVVPEIRIHIILATMRSSPLYVPRNYDPSSGRPWVAAPAAAGSSASSREEKKGPSDAPVSPLFASIREQIVQLDPSTGHVIPGSAVVSFKDMVKGYCTPTGITPLPSKALLLAWNCEIVFVSDERTGKSKYRINFKNRHLPSVLFGSGAPPLPATAEALAPPESGEEDLPRYSVCLHVETGAVIWTHVFRLSEDPGDAFVLADAATDRLFVAGDGNVHCLDAASGTRVGSHSKPRSPSIYLASRELGNGETNRTPVTNVPIVQQRWYGISS